MSQQPFISVILTTHHRPALLRRAINSLLAQNNKNFEIILCADESSSETKYIAYELLRPQDSFFSTPSLRGPAQTRNIGIQIAIGEWICFLDDDDTFEPDYFNIATKYMAGKDSIHFFNYTEVKESRLGNEPKLIQLTKKTIHPHSVNFLESGNCIPINALFISNSIAKQNLFDSHLQSHEDWDWLICLKKQGYKFHQHEYFGPNIHVDENSSRNSDSIKSGSRALDFLTIYRKWPSSSESIRSARANQMAAFGLPIPPFFL